MGQYFQGCILTKPVINPYMNPDEVRLPLYYAFDAMYNNKFEAVFKPNRFDIITHGLKLMEHAWTGLPLMKIFEHLLSEEYYGFPVVWAGDYSPNKNTNDKNLYDYITEEILTESIEKIDHTEHDTWHGIEYIIDTKYLLKQHKYLVNLDKKLYVEIPQTYAIHPLPLLCWDGGVPQDDYIGYNMDLVGSWAYDSIGVTDKIPSGFKMIEAKRIIDHEGNGLIFKENEVL